MVDSTRVVGKCKWWNENKGFGFLVAPGINRDIFVHRHQLDKSNIETLYEEEEVSCVVRDGKKGLYAVELQKGK
jgi:CspA family cold shock protein